MTNNANHLDVVTEKVDISEAIDSSQDEQKHGTIVVIDEEEKAILRKIDMQ